MWIICLLFSADLGVINDTKEFLSSKFEMKDMGEADVILGVKAINVCTARDCGWTVSLIVDMPFAFVMMLNFLFLMLVVPT